MQEVFYKYLIFIFCAFLFFLDKIFALEFVKAYTIPWKKIEIFFYESRDDLLSVYRENLAIHKNEGLSRVVILGTSRSGEFSAHDLQKQLPGFVFYNFSAPLAGPAFHYYWLLKVLETDPNLSLIILEADPILFSKTSLTYTLSYSLDFFFVLENSYFFPKRFIDVWSEENTIGFSWDEVEQWISKRVFYSYRYPPDWNAIIENSRKTVAVLNGKPIFVLGKDYKRLFQEMIYTANQKEYGAIPNQIFHQADEDFLKKDAQNMASIHLGHSFVPSSTQIAFFKKILTLARKKNIDLVVYWPIASDPFYRELDSRGLVREYKERIHTELEKQFEQNPSWKAILWDPNHDRKMDCRAFVDSVHLSGACYRKLFQSLRNHF